MIFIIDLQFFIVSLTENTKIMVKWREYKSLTKDFVSEMSGCEALKDSFASGSSLLSHNILFKFPLVVVSGAWGARFPPGFSLKTNLQTW